jgi:ferredoxin
MKFDASVGGEKSHFVQRDLLRVPGLGRVLLWKHSRTAMQLVLFAVAAMMVVDGLAGSPLAAKNTATVAAWVHYRGLIIVALLLLGNLFCAGCPFLLSRKLAKWIGRPRQRWPRALRNKWTAVSALVMMLFAYELFDLWASPWLTAWVIVGYFVAAFMLEAMFTEDSFCLYVCPLGTFNFLYSTVSPTQITNRSQSVCRDCAGKECINGAYGEQGELSQQGCQLELYVPTLKSNLNCTLCLDCAKACPHDNVALAVRAPGRELLQRSWPRRWDVALLAIVAAFAGLMNAFAMTPPVYELEQRLAALLRTQSEAIVLGLLFAFGVVLMPMLLTLGAAWTSRRVNGPNGDRSLRIYLTRYAYAFVPLGFGIWAAHYLFHLLIGPMTIVPAVQRVFDDMLGVALLGEPNWATAAMWTPSLSAVRAVQMAAMAIGTASALIIGWQAARQVHTEKRIAAVEFSPWLLILLLLSVAAVVIFLMPMEMRGNVLG